MNTRTTDWSGLANLYFYFFYFSGLYQVLIFASLGSSTGLRQSLYVTFLWLVPVVIWPKRTAVITAVLGMMLGLSSLLPLAYFAVYRQDFSQSVIYIVFESNTAESMEYLQQYFQWWMVPAILFYLAVPFCIWRRLRPVHIAHTHRLIFTCAVFCLLAWPLVNKLYVKDKPFDAALQHWQMRMEPATPWQLVIGYWKYSQQLQNLETFLSTIDRLKPLENLTDQEAGRPATLVLVIGESTNRHHMSLYGYPRNTTPELDGMRDQLTVFNHVITPRPYTIEALQQVLTFADQQHPNLFLEKPNLLSLMKQAGYKTYWITNQQTLTARNTLLATFSKQADEQVYLNNNRLQNAAAYDGTVLDPFNTVLHDPAQRKFIVVHLLGTHMDYRYRYPDEFAKFRTSAGAPPWVEEEQLALYNSYDNAIAYNDYVISRLIEAMRDAESYGFLLYLVDHGEEVFDEQQYNFVGRSEMAPTKGMYDIPFILWMSPLWHANHQVAQFAKYVDRPYSTSSFIHSWADLAGLRFVDFDEKQSIVNASFVPSPLWIGDPYSGSLRDLSAEPLKKDDRAAQISMP